MSIMASYGQEAREIFDSTPSGYWNFFYENGLQNFYTNAFTNQLLIMNLMA